MTEQDIKTLLQQELPKILQQDPSVRDFILRTVSDYYAPKQETESRFDRILREIQQDREEQARKWDEQNRKWDEANARFDQLRADSERDRQEQARKWDEQNRKWDEANARFDQLRADSERDRQEQARKWEESQKRLDQIEQHIAESIEEIKALSRKHDSTIGALGARWGLYSEQSFRNALKGILENSFGVEVVNINEYDEEGEVFGRPEQIELDLLIKNGLLIICEIKSSISKPEMYIFEKKVRFYEKRHQQQATRRLVISPMVHPSAQKVAEKLGIEVYSYAEDAKV